VLIACETCRFMRAAGRWSNMVKAFVTVHECRHGAPDNSGWPEIREDDWCACYEPAAKSEVEGLKP
jgi:hypothetical protein